ncbi:hypothetical protein QBC45DRAFT_435297 [Copromyces sp. CBS 386.78]|nr:hypothetical protein QBC45DRAFT_435297 [Copromyces sp. CBS 386.78]
MTRKVVDVELSEGLPPLDISPGDLLSGSASPKSSMTLSEYQHVRALNLLARDRESKLTIIVAAGLAGAYQAPTLKATDPEADMSLIFKQVEYAEQHPTNYPKMTAKEVDWLEQFTICNMSSTPEAEEVVFGRVANWLFGNMLEKKSSRDAVAWRFAHDLGRATYCRRLRDSGRVCPVQLVPNSSGTWSHADAHLVVWELMQVFYLFKFLEEDHRMVYRPDNGDLSRPRGLAVLAGSYVASERQAPDNLSPPLRHPRPSISVLLPWIHDRGERPNSYVWDRTGYFATPPLECKLFECFLRRYCRQRFDDDVFPEAGDWNTYTSRDLCLLANERVGRKFTREAPMASNLTTGSRTRNAGILKDGDFYDGSGGLTSCDPPPTLKYRKLQYFHH